ncbi:hypothetical protein ACSBR2_014122 [Camellia fascicularis]
MGMGMAEDGSPWFVDMEEGECGAEGRKQRFIRCFVDNIPETMGAKGLYSIFSNYGVVLDVFIRNKSRQMTRSRFGFVRYNYSIAADMAVQKANGLWCDDRALKVKMVEFGKEYDTKRRSIRGPPIRKVTEVNHMPTVGYQRKQTYAEAVRARDDVTTTV